MSLKSISLCVYVGMLMVSAGFAQTDQARIVGVVTDTNGAVIPGASVVVKSLKTGQERAVKSNGQGFYVVTNLLPANYNLTAQGEGLGPTEYTEIVLGIGQERGQRHTPAGHPATGSYGLRRRTRGNRHQFRAYRRQRERARSLGASVERAPDLAVVPARAGSRQQRWRRV